MTLMADAAERPRSAPNRFVAIWNSCTASIGRFSSGPPTTSSLLSCPSIDVAAASKLTRRTDQHAIALRGVKEWGGRVAGNEQGELEEVASVERQRFDPLGRDHTVHGRRRHAALSADDQVLYDSRHRELHVEHVILTDLQRDGVGLPAREAREICLEVIGPRRQHREPESPLRVRRGDPCRPSRSRAERHRGCLRRGSCGSRIRPEREAVPGCADTGATMPGAAQRTSATGATAMSSLMND